jgi:hypothetical protein
MRPHLTATFLVLSVATCGCATQHRPAGSSPTTASTSSVAAQHNFGWYLMQPPLHHGDADTRAKLSEWQVVAFFEHASECDAARQQGLKAYPSYLLVSESRQRDSVQMSQRLAASTLCVGADDPRINWFYIKWK